MQNKTNVINKAFSLAFYEQMKDDKKYACCIVRVKNALDKFFGKEDYTVGDVSNLTPHKLQSARQMGRKSIEAIRCFMVRNGLWGGAEDSLYYIIESQRKAIMFYDSLVEKENGKDKVEALLQLREICVRNYLEIIKSQKKENADNQEESPMGCVQ